MTELIYYEEKGDMIRVVERTREDKTWRTRTLGRIRWTWSQGSPFRVAVKAVRGTYL